jgi:hypothetical protein
VRFGVGPPLLAPGTDEAGVGEDELAGSYLDLFRCAVLRRRRRADGGLDRRAERTVDAGLHRVAALVDDPATHSTGIQIEKLGVGGLGLSRTSVTNIERGRQRLLIDQFQRVCKTLDVSADVLLAGVNDARLPVVSQPSELKRMPTVTAYLQRTLVKAGER